jgi:hypothetical protein
MLAVVGARQAARIAGAAGVPPGDQHAEPQRLPDADEVAAQFGPAADAAAAADLAVNGADVRCATGFVLKVGPQGGDGGRLPLADGRQVAMVCDPEEAHGAAARDAAGRSTGCGLTVKG